MGKFPGNLYGHKLKKCVRRRFSQQNRSSEDSLYFLGYPVVISHYGNHKKTDRTANHHYFRIGLYFSSLLVVFSQMINHHPTLIVYDESYYSLFSQYYITKEIPVDHRKTAPSWKIWALLKRKCWQSFAGSNRKGWKHPRNRCFERSAFRNFTEDHVAKVDHILPSGKLT